MFNPSSALSHIWWRPTRARLRQALNYFLLFSVFWMIAAASFSGYISKWGLRDGTPRNGIEVMLEGTAHRPFVYRQLVPAFANFIDGNIPEVSKKIFIEKHQLDSPYINSTTYGKESFRFRYLIICYLSFLALLASAFVLREILVCTGVNSFNSHSGPSAADACSSLPANGGRLFL